MRSRQWVTENDKDSLTTERGIDEGDVTSENSHKDLAESFDVTGFDSKKEANSATIQKGDLIITAKNRVEGEKEVANQKRVLRASCMKRIDWSTTII